MNILANDEQIFYNLCWILARKFFFAQMKLNTIGIKPYMIAPNTSQEYFAPKNGFVLWEVYVDGEALADFVRPFNSTDSIIELKTNIQIPVWADGEWYVSVRRLNNLILWYSHLEFDAFYYSKWDLKDLIFLFDAGDYVSQCLDAMRQTVKFPVPMPSNGGERYFGSQNLTPQELSFLLELDFPESSNFLYCSVADNYFDTKANLVKKIKRLLYSISEFTIVDPPEKQIELRIGLDEAEFTEAIWHIGKVNGQFTICFEYKPSFPVWLQSPEFDKVLSQEPFVKDL